ncbi:Crp/Fnr family transcriptional regulator [Kaistella rhinocerotis]|jgi:CRP-like cAMP-binding protein|uniref:Crp/Fnr family transcriptional regulator n=1 Tax=Kaistella rhinocerotis TaxID=3026437 RepID=UPI002554B352|nr:Crp/Fnr family transcriptional regulator [Kaistella sp. Ran72]
MFTREMLVRGRIPVLQLKRKDVLFREDQRASFLYYLMKGEVKIYNTDSEGKEFLINKVLEHQFLGEPPFLLAERYPATAVITSEIAEVFYFSEDIFQNFMAEHPPMMFGFTKEIAKKAYEKTLRLKSIVHQCPHERVLSFLKIYKRGLGIEDEEKTIINVTRKEMANSTGLAVETVIRTVKKMERENKIELVNHKIYY